MIAINQLSVEFGSFELFKDISFLINPKDRIGLVGKNGAGKSTLLKILMGLEEANRGNISMPSDLNMGYLPQQMICPAGKTVIEETKTAFEELLNLKKKIEDITLELTERTDYHSDSYAKIINQLTEFNDRYNLLGGENINADLEKILLGLGFLHTDFYRQTSEFSGGWKMRIELAKILLKRPDVFLLDEPTNHLDIESIQWLEDFLKNYSGAVVLISHDRMFLDKVTNRTIEISVGKIYDYKVSYSRYVELHAERRQQQLASYENQQKMIAETEQFIERFRYKATKAVQVQSRIKQLEKIDRIEIDETDNTSLHFRFPPAPRSGSVVVETKNLSKNYDEHLVLDEIDLVIEKGEKIAFVGRNGEGKTTLSRIIKNEISYQGTLKMGHNIHIGYFAQNQDEIMDSKKTVFETLDDIAVGDVRKKIRNILGAFLFSGEDSEKKISVLSGGERSRLALAKLLLEPYNLLILDEPTNHLDMRSKEILKQALIKFDGTLIIVSHDRDFLDGLTEKIYEFKNKKIKQHQSGIYEFLKKKKIENLREIEIKDRIEKNKNVDRFSSTKKNYLDKKEQEKELRKIKNKIKKSENNIGYLEQEIEKCENILASPNQETQNQEFYKKYKKFKSDLEIEMENWENFNLELEN